MEGEDTVYDDIEKFEGSGWGYKIPWVNNPVATNCDSISVGVFFWGAYLAHHFCVTYLFSYIHR